MLCGSCQEDLIELLQLPVKLDQFAFHQHGQNGHAIFRAAGFFQNPFNFILEFQMLRVFEQKIGFFSQCLGQDLFGVPILTRSGKIVSSNIICGP